MTPASCRALMPPSAAVASGAAHAAPRVQPVRRYCGLLAATALLMWAERPHPPAAPAVDQDMSICPHPVGEARVPAPRRLSAGPAQAAGKDHQHRPEHLQAAQQPLRQARLPAAGEEV